MGSIINLQAVLMAFLGVFSGIIVGVIPGLTASMAIALLIPFTYALPPIAGISLLLGVYCGGVYGGSITAILIGTPGTPAAVATLIDGYPMARKGDAGKALYYATVGSFVGGVFSCIVLTLVAPKIAAVALRFGSPEYFALAVFGISIVSSISGEEIIKGLSVACVGLLITTIGYDPIGGLPRFTFGQMQLTGGISFIPALIGLFAVSQVIEEVEIKTVLSGIEVTTDVKPTITWEETLSYWKEFIRASVIGTIVGIIPGTGTGIASYLSYNESRRFSRYPEKYGTGIPEGVIASETANNAVTGGALVPLLTLGIPGDGITAIILGGFLIQGIVPGPELFRQNIQLVHGLFIMLFLANVFMLILGLLGIGLFSKIMNVPKNVLLPIILVFCFIGSYSLSNNMFDVWITLSFGVIGYVLNRFQYPLSPLILGMVLGPIAEANLRRALLQSGNDISVFVRRPISAIFLLLAAIGLLLPAIKKGIGILRKAPEANP